MTTIRQYTLGETLPVSPHAVVSCLPTMADVHGYEQKKPEVMRALQSGYPRFVQQALVRKLIAYYMKREGLESRIGRLIPGRRATQDLSDLLGIGVTALLVSEDLYLMHVDAEDEERVARLKKYVQHIGCGISSRQAEDLLLALGQLDHPFHQENSLAAEINLQAYADEMLANVVGCRPRDVLICASGMNAFYAGFRAVQEAQSAKGRKRWLQLGWLYLDSGCILKEFLDEGESLENCYDVMDTTTLVDKIQEVGSELAAVVIECPTNPLVQIGDLKRVFEAVRAVGGIMMVDPTIASIYNMDVMPYCDIVVSSLTKYASYEGDVMIGFLSVNPESPHYGDLVLRTSRFYVPPYVRDLSRLAFEMQSAPQAIQAMNQNAAKLAEFLSQHPAVKEVYFSGYSPNFNLVSKDVGCVGSVLSIVLQGSMEKFYDKAELMKGPSFGVYFTLLCPFMYLAHYDMVMNAQGRGHLLEVGIDPDLIRISVGAEPYEVIESAIGSALSD